MNNKERIKIYKENKGLINIVNTGYNLILEKSSFYTLKDKKKDKEYKKLALTLHHVILNNYSVFKNNYNVEYMTYRLLKYAFEE